MALQVEFSVDQSSDCDTLTFTDTTGVFDAGTNPGGYGAPNPADTDITDVRFEFLLPGETTARVVDTTFLPPTSTQLFLPANFDKNENPDGTWQLTYKVYGANVPSGSIAVNEEYIVTGYDSVTYNSVTYTTNNIFIGVTGVTAYTTSGTGTVGKKESFRTNDFFLYCNTQLCLKELLVKNAKEKCDCDEDFDKKLTELVVRMNGAILAFRYGAKTCANDEIIALDKKCTNLCVDCGC